MFLKRTRRKSIPIPFCRVPKNFFHLFCLFFWNSFLQFAFVSPYIWEVFFACLFLTSSTSHRSCYRTYILQNWKNKKTLKILWKTISTWVKEKDASAKSEWGQRSVKNKTSKTKKDKIKNKTKTKWKSLAKWKWS